MLVPPSFLETPLPSSRLDKHFESIYVALKDYHWAAVSEAGEHVSRLDSLIKLVDQLRNENASLRAEVQTLKRMISE